jgi:hypothetical protein
MAESHWTNSQELFSDDRTEQEDGGEYNHDDQH